MCSINAVAADSASSTENRDRNLTALGSHTGSLSAIMCHARDRPPSRRAVAPGRRAFSDCRKHLRLPLLPHVTVEHRLSNCGRRPICAAWSSPTGEPATRQAFCGSRSRNSLRETTCPTCKRPMNSSAKPTRQPPGAPRLSAPRDDSFSCATRKACSPQTCVTHRPSSERLTIR
jgi:hypothetical protein